MFCLLAHTDDSFAQLLGPVAPMRPVIGNNSARSTSSEGGITHDTQLLLCVVPAPVDRTYHRHAKLSRNLDVLD
jgi:hypothetical protein